jgi:hypothetical protein
MRCFNHRDKEAIAVCRSCGKGVCADCSVDIGRGIACKTGGCEQSTRDCIDLVDRNIQIYKQNAGMKLIEPKQAFTPPSVDNLSFRLTTQVRRNYKQEKGNAIFYCIVGILLLLWAALDIQKYSFILLLGACFIVYSMIIYRRLQTANIPHPQTNKTKTK